MIPGACQSIIEGIQVDTHDIVFGPISEPGITVSIPLEMNGRPLPLRPGANYGCKIRISTLASSGVMGRDSTSWFSHWQALMAVNAMCVRGGQGGIADHIG